MRFRIAFVLVFSVGLVREIAAFRAADVLRSGGIDRFVVLSGNFDRRWIIPSSSVPRPVGVWDVPYPTDPSKLTPRSFCASTANSIGSSLNTSLQKPLTIMFTASSREMPRLLQ